MQVVVNGMNKEVEEENNIMLLHALIRRLNNTYQCYTLGNASKNERSQNMTHVKDPASLAVVEP